MAEREICNHCGQHVSRSALMRHRARCLSDNIALAYNEGFRETFAATPKENPYLATSDCADAFAIGFDDASRNLAASVPRKSRGNSWKHRGACVSVIHGKVSALAQRGN